MNIIHHLNYTKWVASQWLNSSKGLIIIGIIISMCIIDVVLVLWISSSFNSCYIFHMTSNQNMCMQQKLFTIIPYFLFGSIICLVSYIYMRHIKKDD